MNDVLAEMERHKWLLRYRICCLDAGYLASKMGLEFTGRFSHEKPIMRWRKK